MTREQRSGPSACDTGYAYDALGNRLVKDASGALTTSTYDLANQLVTSQDADGGTTYTYDLAGNLHVVQQPTGQRTMTTWDDQNRQTAMLMPDGCAVTNTFRFDGLRHSQEDSAGTTKFLWDWLTDFPDHPRRRYTGAGIPGRIAWLEAGWYEDFSKAEKAALPASACDACSDQYNGILQGHFGSAANRIFLP